MSKNKYIEFCNIENGIPIFSQPWYLDIFCGSNQWDVIIIEKNNEIIASMPYYYLDNDIQMPRLTQNMGPFIKNAELKTDKILTIEKEICNQLISNLPEFKNFHQNFSPKITNWLPFYWKGFKQTTRYTYVLENIKNKDVIYKNFRENLKRDIKKASKNLKIRTDLPIEVIFDLLNKTFERQNIPNPYPFSSLKLLDQKAQSNNQILKIFALDEQNNVHSAVLIVWDRERAYYLISGSDPDFRGSGANSLLIWESIKFCSEFIDIFDFEGSMIEPIEHFVRGFGATQVPYFSVTKNNYNKKEEFLMKVFSKIQSYL
jgi:hypothetical protein